MQKSKQNYGRTMLEMLSVLAIIGILTVSAILGYKYMVNKTVANKIISDGQLIYLDVVDNDTKTKKEWFTSNLLTESKKPFSYMLDITNIPYIKVQEVNKPTCDILLDMKSEHLSFYTEENLEFTTCQEDNILIIDYAGNGAPKECTGYSDCGKGNTSFCSAQGQCETCEGGHVRNEEGTACQCFDSELTCQDKDGNSWCCGENEDYEETICGTTKGECLPSDGSCSYQVSATQTQTKSANCSYLVLPSQTQTKLANCSYQVSEAQTQTKSANCSYTVSATGEVEPLQDCSGKNEYCYLSFKDQNCSAGAGSDITGTIYGTCIFQTSNDGSYCYPSSEIEMLVPLQECTGENEYCYLSFKDQNCSAGAGSDITGTIYGTCIFQTSNDGSYCYPSSEIEMLVPLQDCSGKNEYCYLSFEDYDCSAGAGSDITGTIYGTCIFQTSNDGSYCYPTSEAGMLTPIVDCPANKYCYLNWASESCSPNAGADITGTIYGGCISQTTGSAICPY